MAAGEADGASRCVMTPIADMVARMLAMNVAGDAIVLAIRSIELASANVRGQSADNSDSTAIRREKDRLRKRAERAYKRELQRSSEDAAKANDVAMSSKVSNGLSADSLDNRCESFFLSSSDSSGKKESKTPQERRARARGTRLESGAALSAADRQFARDAGMPEHLIETAWAEFVDYWIGVPGSRGTKLDWPATWRNRVRDLLQRNWKPNGKHHGKRPRSITDAADDLIARAEMQERTLDLEPADYADIGGEESDGARR